MKDMGKYSYNDLIKLLYCCLGENYEGCDNCAFKGCNYCLDKAIGLLDIVAENPFEWVKTFDIKTLDKVFNHKSELYSAAANRKNKTISDAAIKLSEQLDTFSDAQKKEIVAELNLMINNK